MIRLPGLTGGFLAARSGPGRGELSVQGVADDGTGPKRLDFIADHGFHLLVTADLLPELQRHGSIAALRAAGVTIVGLADQCGAAGAVIDVDGTYQRWFSEHRCVAVAVRPDFYVYGTAIDTASALALVNELINALAVSTPRQLVEIN